MVLQGDWSMNGLTGVSMRKKHLSVAMAVVMTVVCLTGCSGSFTKGSFISAAKKNGMREIKETTELNHTMADPGETISFYYEIENMHIFESLGDPLTEYVYIKNVKECVMAVESIGKTDGHGRCTTRIFYLTVKDNDIAEEIYNSAKRPFVKPEEGEKNGVKYTISYQGPKTSQNKDSTVELACGVYLMDNQIVWIRSDYDDTLKNKSVEGFAVHSG